jgi:hypothetical protein
MRNLLNFPNRLNTKFWARVVLNTNVDVRSPAIFRILTGLFLLCFIFPYFIWISDVPQIFYEPPVLSLTNLFNGFPGESFFLLLNVLLIIFAIFITIGVKARCSAIAYIVLLYIGSNFHFSLGKIDHGFTFQFILLFCMSFSDWGAYLAVWPDKKQMPGKNSRALSLLSILLCFGFFTAGFEKALYWINFDLSSNGTGAWFYKELRFRNYLLAPYIATYLPFWGFKIMDFIAVVFELCPLFLLLHSRKAWQFWLMTACVFHICNCLMLNINFITVSIVYLAFVDYSFLYEKAKRFFEIKINYMVCMLILVSIFCIRFYYLLNKIPSPNILIPGYLMVENLYFSLLLSICVLLVLWKSFRLS